MGATLCSTGTQATPRESDHPHSSAWGGALEAPGVDRRDARLLGLRTAELPKGAEQKAMVAWKIRRETTVPLAWIAHRLHMGSASTVTRGALAMEREVKKRRRLRKVATCRAL